MNQKKVTRHSILHTLYDREINGIKTRMNFIKSTYQVINPNCTILNVEKPHCFPRKFTPDGRHFIAFSEDKLCIEVYAYLGCSMAAKLLKNYEENCIGRDENGDVACKRIFESLFQLKHRVLVNVEGEKFKIKCSLFIPNIPYVILGSVGPCNFLETHDYNDIFSSNEALTPNLLYTLANYTIHLVNIENGTVSQRIHFKRDKIFLSHNNGVYLLKDVLAILSVQHQIIYVYKLIENGYHLLRKIGRFCFENDLAFISSVHTDIIAEHFQPSKENITNGLKNKLMIFLYKKAERKSEVAKTQYPLMRFYEFYDHFMSLRMWKMQLIDVDNIIIKYASKDMVTSCKFLEPDTQESSYFMIYNMTTATVLYFYKHTSSDLFHGYEYFCDNFRNPYLNPDGFMPCSPSNNIYSRDSINAEFRYFSTMVEKQLRLQVLPIVAQSFSSSPYLDMSLYSYNEMCVSLMERTKYVNEHPIRFYSRESGTPSFNLYTSISRNKRKSIMLEFIFHPTDPFAISVQLNNLDVNFHIRKVYLPE